MFISLLLALMCLIKASSVLDKQVPAHRKLLASHSQQDVVKAENQPSVEAGLVIWKGDIWSKSLEFRLWQRVNTDLRQDTERWEYQTTWSASWETFMQVRKQPLELDMEQQTGSKWEKEYVKAVYCHPAYLTYMQSTAWEMLGWRKHELESRFPGEISITSDMQMTPPLWQKVKRN